MHHPTALPAKRSLAVNPVRLIGAKPAAPDDSGEPLSTLPDTEHLRELRRLQRRYEAGFCQPGDKDSWPPDHEAVVGSAEYLAMVKWFLSRKPFLPPPVLDVYAHLLGQHMKGKTLTAYVSIDPEDGWTCLWFTVYGCPRTRDAYRPHRGHHEFLEALFEEGLQHRNLFDHVGLAFADAPYRPDQSR